MKKFLFIFVFIFISILATSVSAATEEIKNYDVEIEIIKNSNLYITEKIEYDFATNSRHGIYRDIPITQKKYSENPFKISNIKVTDNIGNPYNFDISYGLNNINIKVGDEDIWVTGTKEYVIEYKVEGAWKFDDQSDVLFWNAIGTAWDVPIIKNSISIYFPEKLSQDQFQDKCFWGIKNSTAECKGAYVTSNTSGEDIDSIIFKTEKLNPSNGVSIDLYFDKGIINQPPPPNIIIAWLKNYGFFFPPLITLIFMLYYWYANGRDPKGRGNIIAQYEPPKDMMPAEMGLLLDESVDNHDFSSEIIYLAIQGYIRIRRIEKKVFFSKTDDYILEKLKEADSSLRDYQIKLLNKLFAKASAIGEFEGIETSPEAISIIKLSDLKKDSKAYKWVKKVKDQVHESAMRHNYFAESPKKIKRKYGLAFIVVFIMFFVGQVGLIASSSGLGISMLVAIAWAISVATCGVIIGVVGYAMPKRTIEGVLLKEHVLGLKEYIDVAEKDRIKFHNDPAKDPEYFEKLLPYAMIFKLEKKWAKKFEGIYTEEPSWYVSGNNSAFSAVAFGSSLGDFSASSVGAISPSSSGGGGGSVGAGGGGGGGGSW